MAKKKKNDSARRLRRFFNYFTTVTATLFGAYWVVMGITGADPSWQETVSNLLLVTLILSAIAGGLVSSLNSISKKG